MNAEFHPVSWSSDSNIYEVNLRQYTREGSFRGFCKTFTEATGYGN